MDNIKEIQTQLVEVIVPFVPSTGNQQRRIQFVDQPYLRYKKMYGLETFTITDLDLSPQGNPLPAASVFKHAYLTLYISKPDDFRVQGEWMQAIPLWRLHNLNNNSDPWERRPFLMDGQTITWEKSYITLSTAIGNTTANVSFLFQVSFSFEEVAGVPNG